jgi:hypothetical protein
MRARRLVPLLGLLAFAAGCRELDVGSDLLWVSRFETGDFTEWTSTPGGEASAFPAPPATIAVSNANAYHGNFSAALTVTAGSDGAQSNSVLALGDNLPAEAYYSTWYYLPHSEAVGTFWVIFKFRQRTNASDPSTADERWDMNLAALPSGEMTLRLYDHATSADVPLDVTAPIVPVERWFQLEAFYRPANDATGRLTFWLDGQQVVDIAGTSTSPSTWTQWVVGSVAENLTPDTVTIYVDDFAISRSRVGLTGELAR